MHVTADMLRKLGASPALVEAIAELFPGGADLTEDLCAEHAEELDWDVLAKLLLPPAAESEYWKAEGAAWRARLVATDAAYAAWAIRKTCTTDEYRRDTDAAWRKYFRAKAAAFGRLAEKMEAKHAPDR